MPFLESAIPDHVQTERTISVKTLQRYEPPFPAYCARFPKEAKELVVAIIGSQHQCTPVDGSVSLEKLLSFIRKSPEALQPFYWEPASVSDSVGAVNQVMIAYWQTEQLYRQWFDQSGFAAWWEALDPKVEQQGWFLEVFLPSMDRFETVFSDHSHPEGAAHSASKMSGPLREHVYWGSMRDRLAAAQADGLVGSRVHESEGANTSTGELNSSTEQQRVRVTARHNLAIIRSGQNWSNARPYKRKLYLETMHPVLVKGMEFLRDQGEEVGCFSCRFMGVLDRNTLQSGGTDKTFGLAYFDDLRSLENWSNSHKTHVDIFGRFLQYVKELQNEVSLRLYHEVMILESHQQLFEYVGCHKQTGMLASLR